MSGTALLIEPGGLDDAMGKLGRLSGVFGGADLMASIGAYVESATRRRIDEEKTGPDGAPWEAWSDDYAATREAQHALLTGEGELQDSIAFTVGANEISIGSNMVYAAIHQFGGAEVGKPGLPARPWLGLSTADRDGVAALIEAETREALR